MVTYEDCLALAELTPEEIDRIAIHERLPEIVALELGSCLTKTAPGRQRLRQIIGNDNAAACGRGEGSQAVILTPISAPVSRPGTKRAPRKTPVGAYPGRCRSTA